MRFKLSHPDYSAYDFYLLAFTPEVEAQINRMGPTDIITSAYDWPRKQYKYHGWTDTINSLWWPRNGDDFATCLLVIDDVRADALEASIAAQVAATASNVAPRPYVILSAMMSPKEGYLDAEGYSPASYNPSAALSSEVELMAWKLYPLAPVRLPEVDGSDTFVGLWLLPLVDIRYFQRTSSLNSLTDGTTTAQGDPFPILRIQKTDTPDWMPVLREWPDDSAEPGHYVAIPNNGTHPGIGSDWAWGKAADFQAGIENWRIVCRDVRSGYNAASGQTQHTDFTGVLADYPDDPAGTYSYHLDAIRLAAVAGNLITGGLSDSAAVQDLIARKLVCLFRVHGDDAWYQIVVYPNQEDPTDVSHISEDTDGLGTEERTYTPRIVMGVEANSRSPISSHRADLLVAAKQWALLYYLWRRKQCFYKYPGIAPLMPNGHSAIIRWDFSQFKWETTYVAIEGVEGNEDANCCFVRQPFYACIDGEGAIADGLDGWYSWTEHDDSTGTLVPKTAGRVGYVRNVDGQSASSNPARSTANKRAVPVGLIVRMIPGTPYLDVTTGEVWDNLRFDTDDLLQVVKLSLTGERNSYGHYGAVVKRWNPDLVDFVDSEVIWVVLLS